MNLNTFRENPSIFIISKTKELLNTDYYPNLSKLINNIDFLNKIKNKIQFFDIENSCKYGCFIMGDFLITCRIIDVLNKEEKVFTD